MILDAYKSKLEQINLIEIASAFVDKNEGRDIHSEGSSFRFFYFVLISFMSEVYISQFFPSKMSS